MKFELEKRKGNYAETLLMPELIKRKFNVSIPFGGGSPYDLVAERAGLVYKIQVKASFQEDDSHQFHTSRHNWSHYSADHVDIFAFYVHKDIRWYLVPFSVLNKRRKIHIYPQKEDHYLTKYLNNWDFELL